MESITTDQVNKTLEIADYSESHEEKESLRFITSCWKLNEINKYIEVKMQLEGANISETQGM